MFRVHPLKFVTNHLLARKVFTNGSVSKCWCPHVALSKSIFQKSSVIAALQKKEELLFKSNQLKVNSSWENVYTSGRNRCK